MNYIQSLCNKWFGKSARLEREIQELGQSFQVKERQGALWITESGVAIKQILSSTTASEIVRTINTAREAAISFKKAEQL